MKAKEENIYSNEQKWRDVKLKINLVEKVSKFYYKKI